MRRPAARLVLSAYLALLPAPGIAADFPSPEADLATVLRFLEAIPSESWHQRPYAPESRVRRHEIQVLRFDILPWEEIDPDAILSGEYAPAIEGSYGVRTGVYCWWDAKPSAMESRVLWYVVAAGRLRSCDHFEFAPDRGCSPNASFRRDEDADLDFVVDLRSEPGLVEYGRTCPGVEAYQRGLAYADAGRMEEAGSLLAFGDGFVRLDENGDVLSAAKGPHCIDAARRLRRPLRDRVAEGAAWLTPPPPSFP